MLKNHLNKVSYAISMPPIAWVVFDTSLFVKFLYRKQFNTVLKRTSFQASYGFKNLNTL